MNSSLDQSASARWTSRQAATGGLIAAFVVFAILVPALALGQPRPARFGWQMYSVAQPAPRAWLEATDGSVHDYNLVDRLAVLRADIPDPKSLGQRLCVMENAAAVLIQLRPAELVRVPCT